MIEATSKLQNSNTPKLTLAIETSCDETSVAITRGMEILSNAIYSQIDLHKAYGGVVPGIAKLAHLQKFDAVLNEALETAGVKLTDVDLIAVTKGPGLAIALEVGIAKAKELAIKLKIPVIAVNHMAGHLYSALAEKGQKSKIKNQNLQFPVLSLLVSGGHTEFVLLPELRSVQVVGSTLDDGCGEAFDKFAMMLGLEYPGGPIVSRLAADYRDKIEIKFERIQRTLFVVGYDIETTTEKYRLPIPMAYSGDLNVSYSGLKTAIKQVINQLSGASQKLNIKQTGKSEKLSVEQIGELCVLFEAAALHVLILKLEQGIEQFSPRELWLGGGVATSPRLQSLVRELAAKHDIVVRIPYDRTLTTDNAGMIGVAAAIQFRSLEVKKLRSNKMYEIYQPGDLNKLDRDPSWEL